jgi:probable rRNA maturation factor
MIYLQIADSIENEIIACGLETHLLEQAAEHVLKMQASAPNGEVVILLGDDEQLHQLNRQFLGIDAPTDVLSFPGGDEDPDSGMLHLGDVIISYPRAAAQAQAGGHPMLAELQLLVVHGVLHLLGYDHASPEEQASMWAVQAQALTELGCPIQAPAS